MVQVLQTNRFSRWLRKLRDRKGKALIVERLVRLETGDYGDHKRFGSICELRIHTGPGYRVYLTERNGEIVILLCGGDKDSQARDIETARKTAQEL